MKKILLLLFPLFAFSGMEAQYLETFTGQNGKGLVDAICPPTATGINDCGCICTAGATDDISTCTVAPPNLSGVNWAISSANFTGFDHTSPDDFGVKFLSGNEVFFASDTDFEMCWTSPTLNIAAAGAVSISISAGEVDGLEADDFIRAEYSLNGGAFTQFGLVAGEFTSTTLSVSGLTGTTLAIRVCIDDNGDPEIIWFDNVSVPQSGVFINCAQPILTTAVTNIVCIPNSGAINLSVSGGTGPYTYLWSNGQTTQDISGLAAGTYTVTVTDAASCPVSTSATVISVPIVQSAVTYPDYCGEDTGAVDLSVSGGNPGYTYLWTGGATTQDISGLAAGNYSVTITDSGGCTSIQSYSVGASSGVGPYQETFSTPNKGYRTAFADDFLGVNWTLSPWSVGRETEDYLNTTAGGKLEGIDTDLEICWTSPEINIAGAGTVQFSTDLAWTGIDAEDYIKVQYSLNGGAFTQVANAVGGGAATIQYSAGADFSGSTTITVPGLTGNTLQIRVCLNSSGNGDIISLDNVSIPQTVSLCSDLCPDDPNKTEPGICGCGVADTDTDGDGTADCNDGCPNDPNKIAAGVCGCGIADTDSDGDGTPNCNDGCPNDPNKIAAGVCGCGIADTDSDGDGTPNCNDGCPNDPNKIAAGVCGCGVADTDSDGDGTPNCNDGCPNDPNKIAAGVCGCGVADTDSDGDGTPNCNDGCPNDPNKIAPGVCGCGVADTDTDGDGTADCNDGCPADPDKTAPGICGCGVADTDTDGDGTADCNDGCPADPDKTAPGICGCGVADTDTDGDGTADCNDGCPADPDKTAPGICGCGVADTDTDGDGTADCNDGCPADPDKTAPGICGCGVADTDTDGDGTADCNDGCPADPDKTAPGICGCGVADTDTDGDGTADCNDGCPADPDKTAPGICGCGVADTDTDGDGTADCNDGCPADPDKTAPGICGCGVADTDTDGDGTADCNDGCPADPDKTAPGICGCGVADTDTDGDGTADCNDGCPADPDKTAPGICGCGVADTDTDGDGTADCNDGCPADPDKTAPGICGCGVADTDTDGDGTADCNDGCPADPDKVTPGVCGCGIPDTDTDGDGVEGCDDNCPFDPNVGQVDSDCDSVGDACDVCPGGDDTVDNNNDGLPDCAYPPAYNQILGAWKCGRNKVYICHGGATICINRTSIADHIAHGDYLGPCGSAGCGSKMEITTPLDGHEGFEIFPNPASDIIHIDLGHFVGQSVELTIYSGIGQKALAMRYPVLETATIQISSNDLKLTDGIYYVKVQSEGKVWTKAFVVAR